MTAQPDVKRCSACGEQKSLSDFYKDSRASDGRYARCKPCHLLMTRAWEQANPEKVRGRRERRREKARQQNRAYESRYPGRKADRRRRWRAANPEKHHAHQAVARAVRTGRIERASACQVCGAVDAVLHAHHADYSKPLEVEWLCPLCHGERHVSKEMSERYG